MILRWMPWKFFLQRAAHHYGFMDPVSFMARMRNFAQPSEVQEPIELLRAGVSFHARGLLNTKAIQNNLDWIWPYWVQKQFNPEDTSFIPRAFSFSHVNLTHRNWTAVGHPQLPLYPIVDPRGLVTPLFDGWSLDFWLIDPQGNCLIPSRCDNVKQELILGPNLAVRTRLEDKGMSLEHYVALELQGRFPVLTVSINASGPDKTKLAVAIRPYNPEGIQFIERLAWNDLKQTLTVNGATHLQMMPSPERVAFSNYENGDVIQHLNDTRDATDCHCKVGMATGAALFDITGKDTTADPDQGHEAYAFHVSVALNDELNWETPTPPDINMQWPEIVDQTCELQIPDKKIQFLYDAAVRTLILLSAKQIVPGPYTYFRFWFRDACLMIHALLAMGLTDRAEKLLREFPKQQKFSGYFQSQEGEWDSNGQVLWILDRFEQVSGRHFDSEMLKAVRKGAAWLRRKRLPDKGGKLHDGLLPPGFSAEHFGPNDYYYWDDFWGVAGLYGASRMFLRAGDKHTARKIEADAQAFEAAVNRSLEALPEQRTQGGLPASPYRRMDSGAIGSLVSDYPLQLFDADDPRVKNSVDFLLKNCFRNGGFFQDMIHSGINAYLTLDVAQTLLRHNDPRYRDLINAVADLASPTGQWPEAIHPITKGGCMGDGQHGWAAAEWLMMMRNLFVREERGHVVIGSGIFPEWLDNDDTISFGPTPTEHGTVSVRIYGKKNEKFISLHGEWRFGFPPIIIQVPGYRSVELDESAEEIPLEPVAQ